MTDERKQRLSAAIQERENSAELLQYVLTVSHRMAAMRSLEPLLAYTMDEVLHFVGAERGYIVLVTGAGELSFKVQRDREGNDLAHGDDAISHSILSDVVATGRSLLLGNAMTDPHYGQAHSVLELQLRSVMCVPLITQSRPLGAIYVENRAVRARFRSQDLAPLELFANQAAVAIENAALNDDLSVAYQQLQELDQLKSNFVMLVSHELRTPLTAVTSYAALLKLMLERSALPADSRLLETQDKLENAVERLNKTIREIIHVFRILSDQYGLQRSLLPLRAVLLPAIEKLSPILDERNLTFSLEGLEGLPPLLLDGPEMGIVFDNVLGNAVKYTPDGGRIVVRGALLADGLEVLVSDSGIGIPPEEQTRVFDLFHVLGSLLNHSTAKHGFRGGGLGLGLPIVRGIVAAHGGTVSLHSAGYDPESCPGTTCRIILPLPPVE
jgi:hypothetical protein